MARALASQIRTKAHSPLASGRLCPFSIPTLSTSTRIRLLDRFRLSRKFGLISLFIFIPIPLTNYLLLDDRLR
ncbi:hypothetical protein D9M70_633390 [compost metagenome]